MKFIFEKDYITETRNIKKETVCSVLDYEVVVGEEQEWLFDVDSGLAKKFGRIIS